MSAPVAFAVCRSYADSAAAVRRALDALGGPARFFKPGCRVLIKPNLLTDAEPARAVTTHPEIVRALIRLAREAGASPCVADSPAGALRVSEVWEKTGFRALCEQEHTPLLNLEKTDSVAFLCDGVRFTIAKPVLEADLVVNAPKVKTHSLTLFTGAIKNLYGTIPGFQKANLHTAFPTPQDMGRLLATIADTIRPGLSVADGVVGMDGNGPSAGHPIPLGFVAASPDPVALDAALCGCLGIPLNRVSGFRHVERARHQDIALLGEPPAPGALRVRLPNTWKYRLIIPRPLARALKRLIWIRPTLDPARCTRCGRCAAACPAKALEYPGKQIPRLIGPRCIGCCCCHELCPVNAIRMTESPLMRLVTKGNLTALAKQNPT